MPGGLNYEIYRRALVLRQAQLGPRGFAAMGDHAGVQGGDLLAPCLHEQKREEGEV